MLAPTKNLKSVDHSQLAASAASLDGFRDVIKSAASAARAKTIKKISKHNEKKHAKHTQKPIAYLHSRCLIQSHGGPCTAAATPLPLIPDPAPPEPSGQLLGQPSCEWLLTWPKPTLSKFVEVWKVFLGWNFFLVTWLPMAGSLWQCSTAL